MQQFLRPYATVGIAIVGVGTVMATPAVTPPHDAGTARDVALTAGGSSLPDLLAPWIEQYNTAADNASQLANNFLLAPGVASQQFASEVSNFLTAYFKDPTNLGVLTEDLQDHIKAASSAVSLTDASSDVVKDAQEFTLNGDHGGTVFGNLASFLPSSIDPDTATTVINFLESPLSGIIIGALGPEIAPWVALSNSISDGDGLNETLANMVGAYFNGATLNLDSLLPEINGAGLLPDGMEIHHLSFAFGGLLSPGDVQHDPWEIFDAGGDTQASIPVVGGSIFNSLGVDILGIPLLGSAETTGHAIGPLGAWQSLSELIAQELGNNWNLQPSCDGKGCTPPPELGVTSPGSTITFPHIPTDPTEVAGGAESDVPGSGATDTDFLTELSDALNNIQWSDVF